MPTIQPSEYSSFGTLHTGAPDRPEPTEAERAAAKKADALDEAAVLALIGIRPNADDVTFPKGRVVTDSTFRLWGQRQWMIWSRAEVQTWRDKITSLARALERGR